MGKVEVSEVRENVGDKIRTTRNKKEKRRIILKVEIGWKPGRRCASPADNEKGRRRFKINWTTPFTALLTV